MARPDSSNKDFRNKNAPKSNFRKHKLYKARFEFSEFPHSDFSAVSAKFCCFIKADLSGSDFTGANLSNANFSGANLTNVNFKSAVLKGANFENAIVEGVDFSQTSITMCKKLKLSKEQTEEMTRKLNERKEKNMIRLEEEKKSPEYQLKKAKEILKKPWVDSVENKEDSNIVVKLKDGYEFTSQEGLNTKTFSSNVDAHIETTKSKIRAL